MSIKYGKFKVALDGINSSRVVVIPENITLTDVHEIIQALFCWGGYHLWEFEDGEGRRYGAEGEDAFFPGEKSLLKPDSVCLSDVLPERGMKLKYWYDFGDDWHHTITRMMDPKETELLCKKSVGPDGIEDIGGVWGLQEAESDWWVPSAEEITERLKSVRLTVRESKTGALDQQRRELDAIIKSLTNDEWSTLKTFSEKGIHTAFCRDFTDFELFIASLPGVQKIRLPNILPCIALTAAPEFKRFWKKNYEAWSKMRK